MIIPQVRILLIFSSHEIIYCQSGSPKTLNFGHRKASRLIASKEDE
jgi:hypothetical protein